MDYIYSELTDIGKYAWDGVKSSTANVTVNSLDSTIKVDVDGINVLLDITPAGNLRVALLNRNEEVVSESITTFPLPQFTYEETLAILSAGE